MGDNDNDNDNTKYTIFRGDESLAEATRRLIISSHFQSHDKPIESYF